MKNGFFSITMVFCATVGLGLVLGCATELPSSVPLSQTRTLTNPYFKPGVSPAVSVSLSDQKPKSVITLGEDQNLAELVKNASGVVLIDFYATWCGPCVKQGKVLHGLEDYASKKKASIIKVDVDQHKELAEVFNWFN